MSTRILLADDHALVRAGVRRVLESQPGFVVVAEAADGEQALAAAQSHEADVLVLDLNMPGRDGFDVLREVRRTKPALKVLVLTMHADPEYVARAVHEGADAYLLKDSAVQDLIAAIEAVRAGGSYYSPQVQSQLAGILRAGRVPRPLELLTDREREVLRRVAAGDPTKQIAADLGISARTVESHRANLMRKLGLRSVALLTQFALREGLLKDGGER